jgi:hypothetical protein
VPIEQSKADSTVSLRQACVTLGSLPC